MNEPIDTDKEGNASDPYGRDVHRGSDRRRFDVKINSKNSDNT